MRKVWLIFAQSATVAMAVLFVVATFKPQWLQGVTWRPALPDATVSVVAQGASAPGRLVSGQIHSSGYADAARTAAPTVVSVITSTSPARNQRGDQWFRYFFGDQQGQAQSGVGSGVIVSPEGYILTNNHVIDHMDDIEVMLVDGRKTQAKVIGTDPETDLAVLKIDLDRLPTITFGNSDNLLVGDAVLAIGNPFGVGQTVTAGIVSALGRNQLGISTFENFIQTDAAINPGNSGGALVDAQGNLVGINSAIYSRSGGSLGIGFAIPVSVARQVMESLIKEGQVTRGWIGVEPRDLTPEIAETFNLPIREGVLITGVLHNGPAALAGIRPGDVVTQVASAPVNNTSQLLNTVAALPPGKPAAVKVQRGNQAMTLSVVVAKRPKATVQPQIRSQEE
ncbi:S1C family serine protease [Aquabacterium sp.]|uniref:S1C family serine protease n=1 Tax=Aquabacterium sp. TaxID=1872578 RepID=UPI002E3629A3|nr:trypsin-like peptidase domain-containing protein [Aquabacterium sp.]HEX5310586.1 trypsin-like peptidase domain-containing protein [Aquabacterium sp.]